MATETKKKDKKSKKAAKNKSKSQEVKQCFDLPLSLNPWDQKGVIPWAQRQFPYLRNEFQHLADSVFNLAEDELYAGDFKPAANVAENPEAYVITLDLPGFDRDAIEVKATDNTLTVTGERDTACCDAAPEDLFFHRSERRRGKFSRTFAIPNNVSEAIAAKYENGVLTITLAKFQPANVRKIKVTS